MPLFSITNGSLTPIQQTNFDLEKQLQTLVESSLQPIFNCRLVASEFSTGSQHGGRIDTLALSEDNNPVIVEYKKVESSELINQSLYILANDEFRYGLPRQEAAAWLRGRIERLFGVSQDPSDLAIESAVDAETFNERLFLRFGFVATTLDHGFQTAIPFICSDFYGHPDVRTGDIPDRNGDRYHRLIRCMMTAFWQILFHDKDDVNDYLDTATVFGRSFELGSWPPPGYLR